MAQLKYYFDLMSQPSRAVFMFLKLNKIPFEACPVALRKGEHMTDEYKKEVHPFSLVPAINDDGFKLTESIAISKYLIGKHNLPDHWFPKTDLCKQARVEEYLHWQHWNTRLNGSMLMQQKLIIPSKTKVLPKEATIERWRKEMTTTVSRLESYFLKDQDYLAGNQMSLADIFGICEMMQLVGCQEKELFENSKTIMAWMDRVKGETQPVFDEAHKIIYRTSEMYAAFAESMKQT